IAYPRAALASLAVITANIGYTLAVVYANRKLQLGFSAAQFGIAASGAGVALCILGQWLKRAGERRSAEHGHASRASLYVFPLFHLALAQAALGVALSAAQALQLLHLAGERTAQEAGGEKIGTGDEEGPPSAHPPILLPHPSYREPLLHTAFLAIGLTGLLCASSWSNYPLVAAALALMTLTLAA